MKPKKPRVQPSIEAGQVWQLAGRASHIGEMGKRLVHYKMLKDKALRGQVSLSNHEDLARHLEEKQAVLVHGRRNAFGCSLQRQASTRFRLGLQ